MAQLQQTRLTNQRLEDEKAELLHEIRKFKGHSAEDFVSSFIIRPPSTKDRGMAVIVLVSSHSVQYTGCSTFNLIVLFYMDSLNKTRSLFYMELLNRVAVCVKMGC